MSDSKSKAAPVIASLQPPAAIAGGDFEIRGSGLTGDNGRQPVVRFGRTAGRLVVGSPSRVVVKVPEDAAEGSLVLEADGRKTAPYPCAIGLAVAENLHPVANPAVDADGNIYTTRSGARGEKVPVSVFKIDLNFNVRPFVSEIINPTGLLAGPDGTLYISSRNNGTIYAVSPNGEVEVYAEGMGVATGIAIDAAGNLFVGDRTGTIFKIAPDRQIFVFATLEPSVSAYHLAMGSDEQLYVTGPTTSSYDAVYRIDEKGDVTEVRRGFGRPQGIVFDAEGKLLVAASYRGRKGVFRMTTQGEELEQTLSGPGIVGLALLPSGELVAATTSSIYRVPAPGLPEA
jgi:sugar lactone lactonase YvrE